MIITSYNNHIKTECRSVRSDRYVWDVDAAGSNPATPTIKLEGPPAT